MNYSPFLSCREAARLITARLDRELGPFESAALRVHLAICDVCPRVVREFDVMRASMRAWRDELAEPGPDVRPDP